MIGENEGVGARAVGAALICLLLGSAALVLVEQRAGAPAPRTARTSSAS